MRRLGSTAIGFLLVALLGASAAVQAVESEQVKVRDAAPVLIGAAGQPGVDPQTRILFTRLAPTALTIYIADADGSHERRLLDGDGLDYNAAFSADGIWIVFTSERGGSADLYRVHP